MHKNHLVLVARWSGFLAAWLLLSHCPAEGEDLEGRGSSPGLQYRRQLVPESEVELRVQQGYMAMRRERFDQMLAAINGQSADQSGGPVVHIQRAVYTARWENGQLVDGQAELDIRHSGPAPVSLSLSPLGVAITRPEWSDDATRAAILGLDSSGNAVLIVDRSATLVFNWSLQAQPELSGSNVFQLQFPPATLSELRLALPPDVLPVVDHGFVEPFERPPGEDSERRTWLLQLRGEGPTELQIVPCEPAPARRQLVMLRQASRYGLTNAGLEYKTTFSLDVHYAPLAELTVEVDPELKVLGARLGDVDVPVRLSQGVAVSAERPAGTPPASEPPGPEAPAAALPQPAAPLRLMLRFPEPVQGIGQELVITGFAPLVVDAAWRLPAVRPVDVIWQQGTATLDVPPTLSLKKLGVESGMETAVEPLLLQLQGESRKLLLYKPAAAIDVTLGYTPNQVSLLSGTTLHINQSLVTARQVARLTGSRGVTFALEARIPNGWIIDNIEPTPADALEPISPWTVRGRRLKIHFQAGLTAAKPVQLVILAHRQVVNLPLGGSEFRVTEFERIGQRRELIAVCPDETHHLVIHRNADVPRLAADSLPAAEKPLIEATAGALVYADSPPAKDFLVGVNFESPRYAGTIDSEAYVEARSLRQSYRIRVEPAGSQVAHVLVHFSQPGSADTHWRLVADAGTGLATRKLLKSEKDLGETWELTLVRPRGEPFEIEAVRISDFESMGHVALASLPEAVSQAATLKIGTADGSPLSIRTENLKSIPVERSNGTTYAKVRGAYRYDPARNAVALVSRADTKGAHHAAWAWQADLVTRVEGFGEVTNVAVYRLENTGRAQVAVTLPPKARFWRIIIDGSESTPESSGMPPRPLFVRLPRDLRFPTLRIHYSVPHPATQVVGQLQPDWPAIDVPCFRQTWSVWLPPAFAAWSSDSRAPYNVEQRNRWDQRLLGYSLQRRSGRPFNLFSQPDWQALVGAIDPKLQAEATAEAVLVQMQAVYTRISEDLNRVPTWGELVQGLARGVYSGVGRPVAVWVDAAGMRDVRVTSLTPIDIGEGQSPWNPQELLAATGVALVVSPAGALLTNRDSLGSLIKRASGLPFRNVVSVADESELAEKRPEWSRPVAAGSWATATPLSQSPWSYPLESQLLDLPTTGWHNYRIPIGSSNASRLTIYQSRYVELLGYVLLVGVTGIAAAFLRRRTRWMLLAIGCFTAVTLLCPLEWVPVARGVLLGLALGLTWTAVQRIPRLSRPPRSYESSIATPLSTRGLGATAVQVLLLILAAVLAARTAFSAEATATPTPARPSAEPQPAATAADGTAPPVTPAIPATPSPDPTDPQSQEPYALVSPVDDQGQPTGGYVYMPRAFYEALYKISASPRLSSQSWLIQSAAYQVTLNSADPAVELGESPRILAEYDAAVLEAGTSIELPLSRAEVTVLDAMLDGQAVPPLWDEAGTSLSFPVESPRQVRISLVLRPRMQASERSFELGMSIPPVPRSSLVVQAASLESVEVPGARGSVQRDASRQEITADLGPADRLVVRWPIPGAVTTAAPEVSVSQLLLLRVHPNSVVLDTRFDFQIQSGVLQHVELLTDSRLQLLPLSPGSPVRQHEIQPGSLQRIRLDLDRPYSGELTIRASFLLSYVRGAGMLTPPHVEVNARRSGPEWLAAWVAPGLAVPPPSDPRVAAQALAEFQSLWGGLDVTPQYVARINPSESPPSISVEPVTSRTESREALDVTVSLDQVTLAFRAALNMRTGAFLQQRLTIPANLTVDDVQLSRDGVGRVLRWADDGSGTLTVFFSAPLSGQHELSLQGSMPTPETLPVVTTTQAEVTDYQCRVYRGTGVRVTVDPGRGWQLATESPPGQYDAGRGRLVATLVGNSQVASNASQTRLGVVPNRPLASGELATTLDFQEGRWWVETDLRATVERGELDSIRFVVPDEIGSTLQFDPDVPFEVIASLEPRRRIVIIRPPTALTGEIRIKMRGELKSLAKEPVRAPEIEAPDIAELRRTIILPTRLGLQQIAWETSGLRSITDERGNSATDAQQTVFQVVGQNPQAVVADVERITGAPQVHLADISLAWQLDGTYRGVAAYDLEPARTSDLAIQLPPHVTLVQCFVAGLPVTALPDGERGWRLPLGPEQWPQRVEILFTGQVALAARDSAGRIFSAPMLSGLPISRTIWSVQAPSESGAGRLHLAHTAISQLQHARIRLEIAQMLLQSAPAVVAQSSVNEAAVWRESWQQRVAAAQRVIGLLNAVSDERTAVGKPQSGDAGQENLMSASPIAADPQQLLPLTPRSPGSFVFSSMRGSSHMIQVEHRDPQSADRSSRILIAALLLSGMAGVALIARAPLVLDWLLPLPYAVIALVGLIWWLLLSPSVVGLVILLLAAWGAVRRPAGSVR